MSGVNVSTRIPKELRDRLNEIAEAERRTMSSILHIAAEHYVRQYGDLHPQFRADILEGLAQMQAGDVGPYERG